MEKEKFNYYRHLHMIQPTRVSSIHDFRYKDTISILIDARKSKGISQVVLAQKMGFTQPDISKIERFERRLDVIEFLDLLEAISSGDSDFFNHIWNKINECHNRSKKG